MAVNPMDFAGGLTQTDWFGAGTGMAQTTASSAAYNQANYFSCVQMRQNQVYQDKNYHLAWVTTARDDVRSVMEASTNRLNNYVLVGTLILQTAIGMLLSDSLGNECPVFVMCAFWISMALSVMFFTTSIVFAVKGQNSAFLNTMRLLTWEIRPENPAAYDYDYMKQGNRFERLGIGQLLRMPGLEAARLGKESPQDGRARDRGKTASTFKNKNLDESSQESFFNDDLPDQTAKAAPAPLSPTAGITVDEKDDGPTSKKCLEQIAPATDELLYLARFGNFMQLWQSFDTHSKYCIGLGLICMTKGATYWSLAKLSANDRNVSDVIIFLMMAIFTYVVVVVYRQSFHARRRGTQCSALILFAMGPLFGVLAVVIKDPTIIARVLRPLCLLSHSWLFLTGWYFSIKETKKPAEVAAKFMTGPAGQRFAVHKPDGDFSDSDSDDTYYDDDSTIDGDSVFSDMGERRSRRKSVSIEDHRVAQVHKTIAQTFRFEMMLAAIIWMVAFIAVCLAESTVFTTWAQGLDMPAIPVAEQILMRWPSRHFRPQALACGHGQAFAASEFKVLRLNVEAGTSEVYPCPVNRTIRDVTLACDCGRDCRPLVLLNDSSVVDCDTGHQPALLQGLKDVAKFSIMPGHDRVAQCSATGNPAGLYNSSLMLLSNVEEHGGYITQCAWRDHRDGWTPLWQLGLLGDVPITKKECLTGGFSDSGCHGAAEGRRLRQIRSGVRANGGRGHGRSFIMQRSGRVGVLLGERDEEELDPHIKTALQNLAYIDDGLLLFRHVNSSFGSLKSNVVTLVKVPTLEVENRWILPFSDPRYLGCQLDKESLLLLSGDSAPKAWRGTY